MTLDDSAGAVESGALEPSRDCPLCPRLAALRRALREEQPDWSNAPVPTFGDPSAPVLIVGLAPGLRGANRTGRPFTGDYAGDLLYRTLLAYGFATGAYGASRDDGLSLRDCAISNAVRCVPPQNKPTPGEIATCRSFLKATLEQSVNLAIVVALGRIAHESTLRALGAKLSAFPFAHGAEHNLRHPSGRSLTLIDSYHCSRYNTNTGVLTPQMFVDVFAAVRRRIADAS
ncbi:uracil-DNA glycosylase [Methylocella silvestris]|uniref:Type-5 uracil-DNA glycosylase n=1 Tax=Methylocella silvestris TaxID=199596 RepID=A0A2J7TJB6_METSI|nr:uracil-DNA glycosylase [Methylocella silvestris]PNG26864.1 uracil-DNA glycosylase [Methylocella silvestris]